MPHTTVKTEKPDADCETDEPAGTIGADTTPGTDDMGGQTSESSNCPEPDDRANELPVPVPAEPALITRPSPAESASSSGSNGTPSKESEGLGTNTTPAEPVRLVAGPQVPVGGEPMVNCQAGKLVNTLQRKQRRALARTFKPRADGSYLVPEDIRKQWADGGSNRDNVVKVFTDANCDPDLALNTCVCRG